MSDLTRTIEIIFAGTDNVSDTVSTIGGNLEDIGAPFADATKLVVGFETAILGVAGAALTMRSNLEAEAAKMENALGLPTAKAEEFEEVANRVYSTGFAGSLEESFGAVTIAAQKFSDETSGGIENIVINASKLNTTFGTDVSESMAAVNTLMNKFGLTSEEAFDFITTGFQDGLNGSDDFLESINEYSTQFSNGGADAGQFFSVLSSGFQDGIAGTDFAADAFKEFRVRIEDGSTTTQEALEQIGLGEEFTNSLANGEITAIEAFGTVIQKLNETDDSSIQMQAGVGLLGTRFEDLGTDAALALSTVGTNMDDLSGKIDSINPDEQLGVKFQSAVNTIKTTILSDDVWDSITAGLGEYFDGFKDNFVAAWENLDNSDFQPLLDSFDDLLESISGMFSDADFDLSSAEGIKEAIGNVFKTIESINSISTGIVDFISPIVSSVSDLIQAFNDLDPETQNIAGKILAFGTAIGTAGGLLATGGAMLGGISSLASALGTGGVLSGAVTSMVALLTGPVGLTVAIGAVATALGAGILDDISDWEYSNRKIEEFKSSLEEIDTFLTDNAQYWTMEISAAIDSGDFDTAWALIDEQIEKEHKVEVITDGAELEEMQAIFEEAGTDIEKEVTVSADTEQATEELEYFIDGERYTVNVPVETSGADEAKKEIEEIPTEKQIEISLQGDIDTQIAQIEASAKTAEAAFKYTAEVDIAQIEAAAAVSVSAFESVGASVVSATESVSSMFDTLAEAYAGDLSIREKWNLEDLMEEQQDAQNKLIDSQVAMNEAETELMKLKAEALNKGDALINIDSSGLEPALEMIMWEILEKVQIKANEESADFLLGIG